MAGAGSGTAVELCERVPGVGRGVMMGVYVQDLMRLDGGAIVYFFMCVVPLFGLSVHVFAHTERRGWLSGRLS